MNESSSDKSKDGEDCEPCFLFRKPFKGSEDPIGSPLPDTPVNQRRKKAIDQVRGINRRDDTIFSSKYVGLEKEVVNPSQRSLEEPAGVHHAEVHEGKVREMRLNFV